MSDRPVLLCVDDETSILNSLKRLFLEEPWEVLFAQSGEEGLKIIGERPVDVVMADFRMPGMDGVELLKRVRGIHPDCMRIVLSGYADINLIVAALNEGQIYKFISKPWNDAELRHTLRKLFEHQRLDRENRRLAGKLGEANRRLEQEVQARTTELERQQHLLRCMRNLLENVPTALVAFNGEKKLMFANACARTLLGDAAERPEALEPDVTRAVEQAHRSPGEVAFVPLVVEGETVGSIVAKVATEMSPCFAALAAAEAVEA